MFAGGPDQAVRLTDFKTGRDTPVKPVFIQGGIGPEPGHGKPVNLEVVGTVEESGSVNQSESVVQTVRTQDQLPERAGPPVLQITGNKFRMDAVEKRLTGIFVKGQAE